MNLDLLDRSKVFNHLVLIHLKIFTTQTALSKKL